MSESLPPAASKVMGWIGLLSVALFVVAFIVCGSLNPDFDLLRDHISKLGARGEPNALLWNGIGFASVGLGLASFGWLLGSAYGDRLLGGCLVMSGVGFAMGAVPTDFEVPDSPASAAHFVAICFALAGWFLALARLVQSPLSDEITKTAVRYAIGLMLLPLIAQGGEMIDEAAAHRLLLLVVFGWITFISARSLLYPDAVVSQDPAINEDPAINKEQDPAISPAPVRREVE
ncbi:MAG: DUF998 domain-containing protein [Planctomycetota bacterium]